MTLAWNKLENLAKQMQATSLMSLFEKDAERVKHFSLTVDNFYLDYSKNFLTQEIKEALVKLAQERNLTQAIEKLRRGDIVNPSENRPALHSLLRASPTAANNFPKKSVTQAIAAQKEKMKSWVEKLQAGQWQGATKKPIQAIVNLGIGGSDLGPKMVCAALAFYRQSALKVHFISNVDPSAILEKLADLDPETTLFIISSKSFTTPETLANAEVAKAWLSRHLPGLSLQAHFIAITTQPEKAQAFGIASDNILTFEEGVGGRFSVWSSIGLPVALSIGEKHFEDFLQGAHAMDEHFFNAPFQENMPVLLALIGIWYINFWQAPTLAVLPYAYGLRYFPDYLQQLDMESNGKCQQVTGETVNHATGPIVWGQAGTNGQHAFYQLLHQGTHFIPIDFIVAAQGHTALTTQHQQLITNAVAQAQALMQGNLQNMPGNKPSNLLLMKALTPYAVGQLLALYEHKIFVQGIIWQINSFDQPGVELGKKLAVDLQRSLKKGEFSVSLDASTRTILEKIALLMKET